MVVETSIYLPAVLQRCRRVAVSKSFACIKRRDESRLYGALIFSHYISTIYALIFIYLILNTNRFLFESDNNHYRFQTKNVQPSDIAPNPQICYDVEDIICLSCSSKQTEIKQYQPIVLENFIFDLARFYRKLVT